MWWCWIKLQESVTHRLGYCLHNWQNSPPLSVLSRSGLVLIVCDVFANLPPCWSLEGMQDSGRCVFRLCCGNNSVFSEGLIFWRGSWRISNIWLQTVLKAVTSAVRCLFFKRIFFVARVLSFGLYAGYSHPAIPPFYLFSQLVKHFVTAVIKS